ncbi:hypothetical protein SD70_07285 [Gordoniibacillus kamchatkensis]|uniref:Extracellular solute-binding protein n=1 Tax=Gordoniibacillus kamchatkensis TaxID=1590651 RepID=A0ABR5AKF5_9BACL|nr:extracellular solute-binding protein [Paenibacillus sp. VKM B-2647]KIL41435.1 hypothetical protein SD70_07285 [Paenibacillus sp. VKM B-2647]
MNGRSFARRRMAAAISAIALTSTVIAGCNAAGTETKQAQGKTDGANNTGAQAAKQPVAIKMMIPYWNAEPPKQGGETLKKIEQHTNTKLDIIWTPGSAYTDKLNASIASQDLPQIVYVLADGNKNAGLVNAIQSGMFWEIGPYLKDYPNLSKINPRLLEESSFDGKIYGIYKHIPQARNGIVYRKDWLDNLGLKEPKTLDELIQVMKAFTFNDPDKNGKQDTIAFGASGPIGLDLFVAWFGGPNKYELKDGKLTPAFMTKEYMDAMKLYKSFYDQNVMNRDFAVQKNDFEMINKGKSGMLFAALEEVESRYVDLYKAFPQAKLDVISRIEGPKGVRVITRGVFPPQFMFPKTSIKTEEQLKQILNYMDKLADPDMQNLFVWGFEGVHYKLENGKPVRTDAQKYNTDVASYEFMRFDDGSKAMKGTNSPILEKALRMQEENFPSAISNPVQALISKTNIERGSELSKIVGDATTKFIMGEIDEGGWNKAVEQWRKGGGDQMIKEYEEAYAKLGKK